LYVVYGKLVEVTEKITLPGWESKKVKLG